MPVVLRPFRSLSTRSRVVLGGSAVVVLGVGSVLWAGGRASGASGYRTATATTRSMEEVLTRVGTIEPVSQATVGFPVDGTVATVDVQVGDTVSVGQVLASLDVTALQTALLGRQAALDAAELTLERALAGEDVPLGSGSESGSGGPEASGVAWSGDALVVTPAVMSEDAELSAAQEAVLAAQQKVDTDMAIAQQALDDATLICAAISEQTPSVEACHDALDAVLSAQETVAGDQAALVTAANALDDLLSERAAELGAEPESAPEPDTAVPDDRTEEASPPSNAGSSGATGTAPSGSGGSSSSSSSPSAQELIAFQKAVDAAAADVVVATQALAQATVVSPVAGTVQAVTVAAGDEVTAGDSATSIVVVGDGGYEVSTIVTVDQLPDLEVGQPATITPDGVDEPLDGEVVGIGVAGTVSGSTTTYPVVVSVTDDGGAAASLHNGSTASLAIVTDGSDDVLAAPTSAVSNEGGLSTVTVLDDEGGTETVTVQVGVAGDVWTEIVGGLEPGQEVVLADLDAPLPSDATDGSSTQTGIEVIRPGGFGGFARDGK